MALAFYTVFFLLMFLGIGLADYFGYPAKAPLIIGLAIPALHTLFYFVRRATRNNTPRNEGTLSAAVYIIGGNGLEEPIAEVPEQREQVPGFVSTGNSHYRIPGMTQSDFRQLAKILADMEWISNRALQDAAGLSRDRAAIPNTYSVLSFLRKNDMVIQIGNGRFKLNEKGKGFCAQI